MNYNVILSFGGNTMPPPIRVNLRRHGLIEPLAWRLAQVSAQAGGGGDEGGEVEGGNDGLDQQRVDDRERAPQARICATAERGETPISPISESVTSAISRWQ